jgi:hypothetical protein
MMGHQSNAIWVELDGVRRRLVDLCREFSVDPNIARSRLRCGWRLEDVLSKPVAKRGAKMACVRELLASGQPVRRVIERGFSHTLVYQAWLDMRKGR